MNLQNRFMFETFEEANGVHQKLFNILRDNGVITYADIYSLLHVSDVCKSSYYKYGWTNLWEAKVEPAEGYINGEWVLVMPKIKLL